MKKLIWLILGISLMTGCEGERVVEKTDAEQITKFLEENLAWTNNEAGKAFCAFEEFGREENRIYLWALCQEFYVQDKEMVCPNIEARETCFVSKTGEECEACKVNEVEDYLVNGSGVSMPIMITEKTDGKMEMWGPRDGSFYASDIRETFPKEWAEMALKHDIKKNLLEENLRKAEEEFGVKSQFEIAEELEEKCETVENCPELPFEFALKSNCPHRMACIEGKCVAGCDDFMDRMEMPILEEGK